jgi:hypothetical protein
MPEHQQFSILRQVAAEHQGGQAEYPAREQVDDLEQHPASQPSPHQACWRKRRSATQSSIRAVQAPPPTAALLTKCGSRTMIIRRDLHQQPTITNYSCRS